MDRSGKQPENYSFEGVPESDRSGRQRRGLSSSLAPTPGQCNPSRMTAGELQL